MSIDAASPLSPFAKNTLVILLGTVEASYGKPATESPDPLQAFSLSAGWLQEYFLQTYKLDEKNLLNLLDGDGSTTHPEEEIAHFLRIRSKKLQQRGTFIQNIIIYCVGYYVVRSSDITLQLCYTREPHQYAPELRLETLAHLLHANTPISQPTRRILLLDGYLSETNARDFAPLPVTITHYVERAFASTKDKARERGDDTVLLCACQPSSRYIGRDNIQALPPSLFTNALLYALTHGDGQIPQESFSVSMLHSLMRDFLSQQYPNTPVQPILATIGQRPGKTNNIEEAIFPNMRRQQSNTLSRRVRSDTAQLWTFKKQKLTDNLLARETSTTNLSPANIARLQAHNPIPLQRTISQHSLSAHQKKLYLYESHLRRLSAIDMITGTTNWSYEQRRYIDPEPIITDNLIYIRADESTLLCLDINTGHSRWSYTAQGSYKLKDTPLIVDGVIYAVFSNDTGDAENRKMSILALDKETGRVLWEIPIKQSIEYPLGAAAGNLLVRTTDNCFHAIAATALWKNWSFAPSNGSISPDQVVARGLVYLVTDRYSSGGSTLHVLDLSTGEERWSHGSFTASQSIGHVPIVYDNFVYVVTHPKMDQYTQNQMPPVQLHAIDTHTGTARWLYQFDGPIAYPPIVKHNRLYIVTRGNAQKESRLSIIEATQGSLLGTIPFITKKTLSTQRQKGTICYAPIIDNDRLYIVCNMRIEQGNDEKRQTIYAVHMPSGRISWEAPLSGLLMDKPVIAHGLMYLLVRENMSGGRGSSVLGNRGRLIVLGTETGKQCWEYAKVEVMNYLPVIAGNLLCLVTANPLADDVRHARTCIRIFSLPEG